jgi:hypothetical protein
MNYTQLSSALQATVENTFPPTATWDDVEYTPAEQIALMFDRAEERIYAQSRFAALRKNVSGALTADRPYLEMPGDYLAVHSLATIDATGRYTFLLNKDVSYLREVYPNPATTGAPRFYAVFGPTTTDTAPPSLTNELSLLVAPTPATALAVELHYFFYPPKISSAGTSWLGDNLGSLLLAGAVLEAALFMKVDEKQLAMYTASFTDALTTAQTMAKSAERADGFRT